jgi:hypothetical protein
MTYQEQINLTANAAVLTFECDGFAAAEQEKAINISGIVALTGTKRTTVEDAVNDKIEEII